MNAAIIFTLASVALKLFTGIEKFKKAIGASVIPTSGAPGSLSPPSIVLIFAPILFPVGMCHPPAGLNLQAASGVAKITSSP